MVSYDLVHCSNLSLNKYGSVQELRSTFRQFYFVLVMFQLTNLTLNEKVLLGYWLNFVRSTLVYIVEFGLVLGLVWLSWAWFG